MRKVAARLPDGELVTVAGLPPREGRWTARRKLEVVCAVAQGVLPLEDACERYALSMDEFREWQRAFSRHGEDGLKTTKLHQTNPERKR